MEWMEWNEWKTYCKLNEIINRGKKSVVFVKVNELNKLNGNGMKYFVCFNGKKYGNEI